LFFVVVLQEFNSEDFKKIIKQEKRIKKLEAKIAILEKQLETSASDARKFHVQYQKVHKKYIISKCAEIRLNTKIGVLNSEIQKQSIIKKEKLIVENMKNIFSEGQMKILSGCAQVRWDSNDIAKSLSLMAISKKSYNTLREMWNIPLPSISTLRNWAASVRCDNGILEDVFLMLKAESESMDDFSKLCTICFDEMSIESSIVWDKSKDMIIGPHKKVQVVLLRGICSKWQQPIFYNFDTNISKALLFELIIKLESISFKVCAIVSDLGGNNQQLWNELNISVSNCNFQNPFDSSRSVEVFGDPPHIMKLLRNHSIDHGIVLPSGVLISRFEIQKLVDFDGGELKICPKLTQSIIDVKGAERMRVSPAVKILSHHTASLSKLCFPDKPEIAYFFSTFDDYFDIFNSRLPKDNDKEIRSGYGMSLTKQNEALDQIYNMAANMRVRYYSKKYNNMVTRKGLLPFQNFILISITSLKNLLSSLGERFNVSYIITRRLNQDPLESLFSVIRSLGRTNESPSPYDFKNRMKIMLLGSKIKSPVGSNVQYEEDHTYYISRRLLEICRDTNTESDLNTDTSENKSSEDNQVQLNNQLLNTELLSDYSQITMSALTYLAGYIAYAVKRKYKQIYGTISRKYLEDTTNETLTSHSHNSNESIDWIMELSRGGLMVPTSELVDWVQKCEIYFTTHCSTIKNIPNISNVITHGINSAYPDINDNVVKEFTLIRLKIRIKHMNKFKKGGKGNSSPSQYGPSVSRINVKKSKQFLKSK